MLPKVLSKAFKIDDQRALLDDLVARCEHAKNPIPGIFFLLGPESYNFDFEYRQMEALKQLLLIDPPHPDDWLRLHALKNIHRQSREMGLQPQKYLLPKGLDKLFRRPGSDPEASYAVRFADAGKVETKITTDAWTLPGMLKLRKQSKLSEIFFEAMALKMPGGMFPGLRSPESMPITERFVIQRGLQEPLNQWLPAFRQAATHKVPAQTYDLADLAVAMGDASGFNECFDLISKATSDSLEAKAGYFARQAAHAYDTLAPAERDVFPKEDFHGYEFVPFGLRAAISNALFYGARISQDAWSGPGTNARPLRIQKNDVREMIYAVIDSLHILKDEELVSVIQKMRSEGHDVAVLHQNHAVRNQAEKPLQLPLHMCAQLGLVKCFGELIAAGADHKAKVYVNKTEGQTIEDVIANNSNREGNDAILSMLRSLHARHVATNLLQEMESGHKPQVARL